MEYVVIAAYFATLLVIGVVAGLALTGGGVFFWIKAKPTYVVLIGTAGQEVSALRQTSGEYANWVVAKINEAIITLSTTAA